MADHYVGPKPDIRAPKKTGICSDLHLILSLSPMSSTDHSSLSIERGRESTQPTSEEEKNASKPKLWVIQCWANLHTDHASDNGRNAALEACGQYLLHCFHPFINANIVMTTHDYDLDAFSFSYLPSPYHPSSPCSAVLLLMWLFLCSPFISPLVPLPQPRSHSLAYDSWWR